MTEEPAVVVERLAKGLLRGLDIAGRFLPYTDPADFAQQPLVPPRRGGRGVELPPP
jgi:hypothetical protein